MKTNERMHRDNTETHLTTDESNARSIAEPLRTCLESINEVTARANAKHTSALARQREVQKEWRRFKKNAEQRAQTLEATANATRLIAMAQDPMDALRVIVDLSSLSMIAVGRKMARLTRNPEPPPYALASNLLTGFTRLLAEKTVATFLLLDIDEQERIKRIMPAFMRALEDSDPEVRSIVSRLMPMPPEDAAAWIRQNLDTIEPGFVS